MGGRVVAAAWSRPGAGHGAYRRGRHGCPVTDRRSRGGGAGGGAARCCWDAACDRWVEGCRGGPCCLPRPHRRRLGGGPARPRVGRGVGRGGARAGVCARCLARRGRAGGDGGGRHVGGRVYAVGHRRHIIPGADRVRVAHPRACRFRHAHPHACRHGRAHPDACGRRCPHLHARRCPWAHAHTRDQRRRFAGGGRRDPSPCTRFFARAAAIAARCACVGRRPRRPGARHDRVSARGRRGGVGAHGWGGAGAGAGAGVATARGYGPGHSPRGGRGGAQRGPRRRHCGCCWCRWLWRATRRSRLAAGAVGRGARGAARRRGRALRGPQFVRRERHGT